VVDANTNRTASGVKSYILCQSFVSKIRHFDGLSIKEIAEVLNANEGTIKSRLFYATKYLAEGLKEFNPVNEL